MSYHPAPRLPGQFWHGTIFWCGLRLLAFYALEGPTGIAPALSLTELAKYHLKPICNRREGTFIEPLIRDSGFGLTPDHVGHKLLVMTPDPGWTPYAPWATPYTPWGTPNAPWGTPNAPWGA
eukprot:363769-Chlamydomonas_euryale.AAC.5